MDKVGLGERFHRAAATSYNLHCQFGHLVNLIRSGQNELVLALVRSEPSLLSFRDGMGRSALHHCADCYGVDKVKGVICKVLLRFKPCMVEWQDNEGNTALHLAVINGDSSLVANLLSGMSANQIDIADYELHTAVHWAVVGGQLDALIKTLDHGANPSTPDIYGAYPLHYATQNIAHLLPTNTTRRDNHLPKRRANSLAILHHLLSQAQIDVNCVDNEQRTPLIWSASSGNHDALLVLIKAGAEISQQDKDGLSALHCASSRGHYRCVHTLITMCGADVHQLDSGGCTPLFYAVALGHADCVKLLIESGARLDHQDNKGRTAAHCGASKGQLETLKMLQQHGANMSIKNIRGDLPLHDAVKSGRTDLVKWLLDQNNKSVNEVNLYGRSPLHIAAFNHNLEMCRLLVSYGADVNAVMKVRSQYLTPLDAAMQNTTSTANDELLDYLGKQGAQPIAQVDRHLAQYTSTSAASVALGPDPNNNFDTETDLDVDHIGKFNIDHVTNKINSIRQSSQDQMEAMDHFEKFDQQNIYCQHGKTSRRSKTSSLKQSTKLPNIVPQDTTANHNDKSRSVLSAKSISASSSTSTSSDGTHSIVQPNSDHVKNVRQFETVLQAPTSKHGTHLKQAIITNVYLTTPTAAALAPVETISMPQTASSVAFSPSTAPLTASTSAALLPIYYVKRVTPLKKLSTTPSSSKTKKMNGKLSKKSKDIPAPPSVQVVMQTHDTFKQDGQFKEKHSIIEHHLAIQDTDTESINQTKSLIEQKAQLQFDSIIKQDSDQGPESIEKLKPTEELDSDKETDSIKKLTPNQEPRSIEIQDSDDQPEMRNVQQESDGEQQLKNLDSNVYMETVEKTQSDQEQQSLAKPESDQESDSEIKPEIAQETEPSERAESDQETESELKPEVAQETEPSERVESDQETDSEIKPEVAQEPHAIADSDEESGQLVEKPESDKDLELVTNIESDQNTKTGPDEELGLAEKEDESEVSSKLNQIETRPEWETEQRQENEEVTKSNLDDLNKSNEITEQQTSDQPKLREPCKDDGLENKQQSDLNRLEEKTSTDERTPDSGFETEHIHNTQQQIDRNDQSQDKQHTGCLNEHLKTVEEDTTTIMNGIEMEHYDQHGKHMIDIDYQTKIIHCKEKQHVEDEEEKTNIIHSSDVESDIQSIDSKRLHEATSLRERVRRSSYTKHSVEQDHDHQIDQQNVHNDNTTFMDENDGLKDNIQHSDSTSAFVSSFGPIRELKGKKKSYGHVRAKVNSYWSDEYHNQTHRNVRSNVSKHGGSTGYLACTAHDAHYARIDPKFINQTVEKYLRKYYLERQLFEELYDLKRYQIRTGRTNEPQAVRRLADRFRRETKAPGMSDFKGPYTYRAYEIYLYDLLRQLSRSNQKKIAYLTKSISYEDLAASFERLQADDPLIYSSDEYNQYSHYNQYKNKGDKQAHYYSITNDDKHTNGTEEPTSTDDEISDHNEHRRPSLLDYERQPFGLVVDYKYEYHKSQHKTKPDAIHQGQLIDVISENLYKRTGIGGTKMDETAVTRKIIERSNRVPNENGTDKENHSRSPNKNMNHEGKGGGQDRTDHQVRTDDAINAIYNDHLLMKNNASRCYVYGHRPGRTTSNRIDRDKLASLAKTPITKKRRIVLVRGQFRQPYKTLSKQIQKQIHQRWNRIKQLEKDGLSKSTESSSLDSDVTLWFELNTKYRPKIKILEPY